MWGGRKHADRMVKAKHFTKLTEGQSGDVFWWKCKYCKKDFAAKRRHASTTWRRMCDCYQVQPHAASKRAGRPVRAEKEGRASGRAGGRGRAEKGARLTSNNH